MSTGHCDLFGVDLHVPGYIQSVDPGAVGEGMLWVDTSGGAGKWSLWVRNEADDGWELIDVELPNDATVVNVNYYEVAENDLHLLVVIEDDAQIILPQATTFDKRTVHIKRTSDNQYDVEISVIAGGGLVEGGALYLLKHKYEAITCVAINGDWWIY